MNKIADYLDRMLQDPDGSPSSTRHAAVLLVFAAVALSVWAFVIRWSDGVHYVEALLGGGALNFFARKKSDGAT